VRDSNETPKLAQEHFIFAARRLRDANYGNGLADVDRVATASEIAEYLDVPKSTVLRWLSEGIIPGRQSGKRNIWLASLSYVNLVLLSVYGQSRLRPHDLDGLES